MPTALFYEFICWFWFHHMYIFLSDCWFLFTMVKYARQTIFCVTLAVLDILLSMNRTFVVCTKHTITNSIGAIQSISDTWTFHFKHSLHSPMTHQNLWKYFPSSSFSFRFTLIFGHAICAAASHALKDTMILSTFMIPLCAYLHESFFMWSMHVVNDWLLIVYESFSSDL